MPHRLSSVKKNNPEKYERIGMALEEFVCEGTLQKQLEKKYSVGANTLAAAIEEYFGKPGEAVMIQFESHEL